MAWGAPTTSTLYYPVSPTRQTLPNGWISLEAIHPAPMKLIYLVSGPMGRTPEGQAELGRRREYLQRHAAAGTEVDITDIPAGPGSIESMYEEYLSIPETVKRAHELQADGWDGILLGCYGDPGLGALREIVDIPVVGAGQATALMASAVGRRYSVITVTDSVIGPLEETMRNSGGGDKLASVRAVNIPVLELHRDRELAIEVDAGRGGESDQRRPRRHPDRRLHEHGLPRDSGSLPSRIGRALFESGARATEVPGSDAGVGAEPLEAGLYDAAEDRLRAGGVAGDLYYSKN